MVSTSLLPVEASGPPPLPMPYQASSSHALPQGNGSMLAPAQHHNPAAQHGPAAVFTGCPNRAGEPSSCSAGVTLPAAAQLDHAALARAFGMKPEALKQVLDQAQTTGSQGVAQAMPRLTPHSPVRPPAVHTQPPPMASQRHEVMPTDATASTGSGGLPAVPSAAATGLRGRQQDAAGEEAGETAGEAAGEAAGKAGSEAAGAAAVSAGAEMTHARTSACSSLDLTEGSERIDMFGRRKVYYTAEEVARHNHPGDCWLIAHGKVYNVTSFLPRHPAGEFAILRHGGMDSTQDYDFHSSKAQRMWTPYHIGYVETAASARAADCIIS